jgi:RimJ/RimL family protein N-acetyltransferase
VQLRGRQVIPRAHRREDAAALPAQVWGEPGAVPYPALWARPQSLPETGAFLAAGAGPRPKPAREVRLARAPADDPAQRHVGGCEPHEAPRHNRSAVPGTLSARPVRHGRGYGTEAVAVLAGHGGDTPGPHEVGPATYEPSARAIRCRLRRGFRQAGRRRQGRLPAGRCRRDEVRTGIAEGEYRSHAHRV